MGAKLPARSQGSGAEPPSTPAQRDHAQALYDRVLGWYESAERKAPLILTLDGVFLSFLATVAFQDPPQLRAVTDEFGPETWAAIALMALALAISIISSVDALRSRRADGKAPAADSAQAYEPANTWFFEHIAKLDPGRLGDTLARADSVVAVRALAAQAVELAQNVTCKHRLVNRGFLFAGAVLVFFLLAAGSYVARVA